MKITMEDGERWANLRDQSDKFKSWERRSLYEKYGEMEGGAQARELRLIQLMLCHLLRDWSLDLPRPGVTFDAATGAIEYVNVSSIDLLDYDMENELLGVAGVWLKQVAINFSASPEPASPTVPSGA